VLKQRVITASILAICFLLALFSSSWQVFAAFTGVVFLFAFWEWSNLAGLSSLVVRGLYTLVSVALSLGFAWWLDWTRNTEALQVFLGVTVFWWAIALLWVQGYPSSAAIWGHSSIRIVMGWFVLIPAWVACMYLRTQEQGPWIVLLVVLLVATADIAAFFAGRAYGKRKLAPLVSPGKSWEGVWAGMLATALLGVIYSMLFNGNSLQSVLIVVLPTAFVSVLGDLLESMVKRHRGVKDSGHLLPGHGGFLDRVDGLVASVPTFALMMLLTGWTL